LPPNLITNIGLSMGLSKAITLAVRRVSLAFNIKQNIFALSASTSLALICDIFN
jgi:hypothetical protein